MKKLILLGLASLLGVSLLACQQDKRKQSISKSKEKYKNSGDTDNIEWAKSFTKKTEGGGDCFQLDKAEEFFTKLPNEPILIYTHNLMVSPTTDDPSEAQRRSYFLSDKAKVKPGFESLEAKNLSKSKFVGRFFGAKQDASCSSVTLASGERWTINRSDKLSLDLSNSETGEKLAIGVFGKEKLFVQIERSMRDVPVCGVNQSSRLNVIETYVLGRATQETSFLIHPTFARLLYNNVAQVEEIKDPTNKGGRSRKNRASKIAQIHPRVEVGMGTYNFVIEKIRTGQIADTCGK